MPRPGGPAVPSPPTHEHAARADLEGMHRFAALCIFVALVATACLPSADSESANSDAESGAESLLLAFADEPAADQGGTDTGEADEKD